MFTPESYLIIAHIFPRLLGIIYLLAIGALLFQIKGLIGKNGILPLTNYLELLRTYYPHKRYFYTPTLFWLNASDRTIMGVVFAGTLFATCLIFGFFPSLMLLLLYFIHLSIIAAGQEFLSFGWEGLLLEITAHTFLLSLTPIPNLLVWMSINFLLFRFHFQAGVIKLQSQDPTWRNLTAIAYHYQTQPLPNTVAWFIHKMPLWFHKLSVLFVFFVELILPFGIFGTESMRFIVFIGFVSLQFMIWWTGNFSYLNHMTAVFSTLLLGDDILSKWFAIPNVTTYHPPIALNGFLSLLGGILIALQCIRFWHHFWPNLYLAKILHGIAPFHLANRYMIFANMTTERYEIIIEGSEDGKVWKEYLFKYKPSETTRHPRRISPYQPRLDWQIWFLPFTTFYSEKWFQSFLHHLLKGTPEVLQLLRRNPFPTHPPQYIRALAYEYVFSTMQERVEKGWWWRRQLIGPYSPTLKLTLRKRQANEETRDFEPHSLQKN